MQRHGTQSRELLIARCAPPANDSYGGSHDDIWDPCPFFIESSENLSSLQAPWHVRSAQAELAKYRRSTVLQRQALSFIEQSLRIDGYRSQSMMGDVRGSIHVRTACETYTDFVPPCLDCTTADHSAETTPVQKPCCSSESPICTRHPRSRSTATFSALCAHLPFCSSFAERVILPVLPPCHFLPDSIRRSRQFSNCEKPHPEFGCSSIHNNCILRVITRRWSIYRRSLIRLSQFVPGRYCTIEAQSRLPTLDIPRAVFIRFHTQVD